MEAKIRTLPVADRGMALLKEIRDDLHERSRRMQESLARDLLAECQARGLELKVLRREEPVQVRIPPLRRPRSTARRAVRN